MKKLGTIPDGGEQNRAARPGKAKNKHSRPKTGTAFVHTVIDDRSRLAHAQIDDDQKAVTAAAVLRCAVSWYAARGVQVLRVPSDDGSAYRARLWRDVCAELPIVHKRTRPYRPQTDG